ncbi:MAG: acetylornithine deacetylase [Planctomycetota bacterium]|jgi:acetylornithine deacetylase
MMSKNEISELLSLHQALVKIPSVSGSEDEIVTFVADYLKDRGADVEIHERNVIAWSPENPNPDLVFNSHLDTVPVSKAWTRDPYDVGQVSDRTFGLGSNDAKASVAAMIFSFLRVLDCDPANAWGLTLVADEETGGRGSEIVIPRVQKMGWPVRGIVVGEPTGLAIATSQKGLLIVEVSHQGTVCHSANATKLGAKNAIVELAKDIAVVNALDLGKPHPELGSTSIQPTVMEAGGARNTLPQEAKCLFDIRTSPGETHEDLIQKIDDTSEGDVNVVSKRLRSMECPPEAEVLKAALAANPQATCYGSPTMSDWVYCGDIAAIKCGPGESVRSHQGDEYVLHDELVKGVEFYFALGSHFKKGRTHGSAMEQG